MSPEERALRYWNSVRANYPSLSPDASDFWEACPTHLAKEFRSARAEAFREAAEAWPRTVRCPDCGAPPERECESILGTVDAHTARWRAAIRALIPKETR